MKALSIVKSAVLIFAICSVSSVADAQVGAYPYYPPYPYYGMPYYGYGFSGMTMSTGSSFFSAGKYVPFTMNLGYGYFPYMGYPSYYPYYSPFMYSGFGTSGMSNSNYQSFGLSGGLSGRNKSGTRSWSLGFGGSSFSNSFSGASSLWGWYPGR